MANPTNDKQSFDFQLDAALPEPLYRQLYERIRGAILAGQLPPGARLPSTRALATELGISRSTTVLAYDHLLHEGYLTSQVGRGTEVSREIPLSLLTAPSQQAQTKTPAHATDLRLAGRIRQLGAIPAAAPLEGAPGGRPFLAGQPALDLFPYRLWARLIARRARHSLALHGYYQSHAGYRPLREAIAAHIAISRGVRCTPDQVIITSGTQGALDLAARVLIDPGDAAWFENPGYFGALGALTLAGAQLAPVPVDAEGLDVEAGLQRSPNARFVAVTPSHHFPTGVTMSLRRRLALLGWAERHEAWIVEDDYDSEYRFDGRPQAALQALDRAGRVLYIGSFSKMLLPSLRLGYIVVPPQLVEPMLATRRNIDVHPPILEQLALADFIQEGHFVRHLRRMRRHYQRRRDCLLHELNKQLAGLLDVYAPEAGMQLAGWLPPEMDDRQVSKAANAAGIMVPPISFFSLEPLPRGGLLFGFAGIPEADIRRGVKTLTGVLERL